MFLGKLKDSLYAVAPVCAQNLALSLQGTLWARRRYSSEFTGYFRYYFEDLCLAPEELLERRTMALRELLAEAHQHVPYYREVLSPWAGRLSSFQLSDLPELPILHKQVLRTRMRDLENESRLRRFGYLTGHTSGSTGTPITYRYDWDSMRRNLALREVQYRIAGVTWRDRSVRFSGRLILGAHDGPPYWRWNAAENQYFVSTYHLREDSIPQIVEFIGNVRPVYLDGYPSALEVIAKWLLWKGQRLRVPVVITTAETLRDDQRQLLQEAFSARVHSFYSSSEGAPFIIQFPGGEFAELPSSGIFEYLREDGAPAAPGEPARLLVTSFFQRSFPLIRYEIGDLAVKGEGTVGRGLPAVAAVIGRQEDLLYTKERGWVGRLDAAFKTIPPSIVKAQVAQVGEDRFELRYVPDQDRFRDQHLDEVMQQLRARLGSAVTIVPVRCVELAIGASGKFPAVVNEYLRQRREVAG